MTKQSTMQPFAKGDVFVGATVLNNPDDDHAGDGRIIQYDNDLNEKGVLWTEGTSHLVNGLKFSPDGVLWAFDQHNYSVVTVSPDGKQQPNKHFANRTLSHVNFVSDGTLWFGEHLQGDKAPENLGTHFPVMPEDGRVGDGKLYHFKANGELIEALDNETHGGITGYLGVTTSVLTPDEKRLIYVSETGNKIFQWDLTNNKQLPPLATYEEGRPGMVFCLAYGSDGRFFVTRGNRIEHVDDNSGETLNQWPLEGFGWAVITVSADNRHVFVGNFFNGEVAKVDLESGNKVASANIGVERSLAGVAEYPG